MGIRIAFVGKPASGQVTAAVYLKHHKGFKRVRMIDGVRRICKFIYGLKKYERIPFEKQRAMYDAYYKLDPNIWITYIEDRLNKTTEPVVVDDAKYINEVKRLKELGFTIIRINAAAKVRTKSIGRFLGKDVIPGTVIITEYFNKDATEILGVDYSIYHDGNPNNLRKTIDELLTKFDKDGKLIA